MFKLNNKGFGKYEVLTVITLLLIIFVVLSLTVLGGAGKKQFDTMSKEAIQFNKSVYSNLDSFHDQRLVYLEEVIDEKILNKVKSPYSMGVCDVTQSSVRTEDDVKRFVTLKCDNYLIDNSRVSSAEDFNIYKVSKWSDKKIKGDNVEKKELYNCEKKGKKILDNYVEDGYLVYKVNKDYNENYYFASDISEDICKVVTKTFYRTKELVHEVK